MDADIIRTYAEIGTAIGTFALALATYGFTKDGRRQAKRDKIAKEMEMLILPLMTVYHEIDPRGFQSNWWMLYFPRSPSEDPVTKGRFIDAVKSIDQYKYLAPEKLRRLIDDFLLRLNDMKTSTDANFQGALFGATDRLFGVVNNTKGGFVMQREYELTKELDALNKDFISKTRDFVTNIRLRLHLIRKPPKLEPPQLL